MAIAGQSTDTNTDEHNHPYPMPYMPYMQLRERARAGAALGCAGPAAAQRASGAGGAGGADAAASRSLAAAEVAWWRMACSALVWCTALRWECCLCNARTAATAPTLLQQLASRCDPLDC